MKNDYRTLRKAILERRDDHVFVDLMAKGLGKEVLEELVSDFAKYPDGNYHLIAPFREALDRIQRTKEFKDRMREDLCKRNEPLTQLQAWYADKKSGKVVYARKQIQKRFMHLDYADQLKLMRTMLNGGYFLTGYLADKVAMDGQIMGDAFSESDSDDNLPF